MGLDVSAEFVGEVVELNWVELVVSSGGGDDGIFSTMNLSSGWLEVWVGLEEPSDSSFSFSSTDLTVMVGVNLGEDFVRLIHGDTRSSSDLDGGGGGDEGDKGEFHF